MIRSPILIAMGHVDHGKTTLADKVRGSAVALAEPGLITQYISTTYIPTDKIKCLCGELLEKLRIQTDIPGLLWIDSPGHEAFTSLRKRGGAIADLAILVIDLHEGFKPQTDESLSYLKQFKTPFVVAATKIDRIMGWAPVEDACFHESFAEQNDRARGELEEKVYRIVSQLSARGFESERIDRINDFTKQVCIVPVSGITGEGIADLLMVLIGLAQKFLRKDLETKPGEGKGSVLEVKEFPGLGTTIDIILYDGELKKGDFLVIGGKEAIKTKVKAILVPKPLKELKTGKDFEQMETVSAAAGVKIAAPGLETVKAGSPFRATSDEKNVPKLLTELKSEMEEVKLETEKTGVLVKTDTLGSLEAVVKILTDLQIPIRKAVIGDVTKSDILELRSLAEPVIIAFGCRVPQDVLKFADDNNVAVFHSNVIYQIIEDYQRWVADREKRAVEKLLAATVRPGRVKVLPGFVFRQKEPAVFGVEVLKGTIRPHYRLQKGDSILGEIKEIQDQGIAKEEAVMGDRFAISVDGIVIGRNVREGDELDVFLADKDKENLNKLRDKLRADEIELLDEILG